MTDTNPRKDMAKLSLHLRDCVQKADGNWAYVNIDVLLDAAEYLERFAQPEPEVPTEEEILALSQKHGVSYTMLSGDVIYGGQGGNDMRDDVLSFAHELLARWGSPVFRQKELTDEQLLKCFKIATPCYNMEGWRRELDGMRAAIAADRTLCARPAVEPVPVSERLPRPEDCDAEGRCWYFFMDSVIGGCGWQMFNEEENQQLEASHFWLPHWSLPVPTDSANPLITL